MRLRLLAFFALCAACGPISDPPYNDSPVGATHRPPNSSVDAGTAGPIRGEEGAMDAGLPAASAPPGDAATLGAAPDAGDAGVPSEAGDAGVPSEAGDAVIPSEAGDASCRSQTSDSGIQGVTIQIEGDRCSFPYGQGGTFRYRVTLDHALSYDVAAGSSCGFCGKFGADAESLVRATVLGAGGTSYCATCDLGCCPPNRAGSYVLGVQSFSGMLDWPARSWSGPSDTGAKPGDFFSRGAGSVQVALELPNGVRAVGLLPIAIE